METNFDEEYDEYIKADRVWGIVKKENIRKLKFQRIDQAIIDEFLKYDDLTSTISDILDSLGVRGVVPATKLPPLNAGQKIVGTAVTIRNIPERKTPTQGSIDKDFIRMASRDLYYYAEPGDVAVSDFGGNDEVSNMGGQSALVAKTQGLAGSIVNGCIRDVATIRAMDYPVWCKGGTPLTGKFRLQAVEINCPVTVHDIVVYPGDLIVADDSGVCAIPAEHAEYVLKQFKDITAAEEFMQDLIRKKAPISELKPHFRKRYTG